jgi:hypothetical protein
MYQVITFWGKCLGTFSTIGECCRAGGLTPLEVAYSIQTGNSTAHGHTVQFTDDYLRKCAINSLIKQHGSFTQDEIAAMLGISLSTVVKTLRASLNKLRGSQT